MKYWLKNKKKHTLIQDEIVLALGSTSNSYEKGWRKQDKCWERVKQRLDPFDKITRHIIVTR
jgi:hypothetical protein